MPGKLIQPLSDRFPCLIVAATIASVFYIGCIEDNPVDSISDPTPAAISDLKVDSVLMDTAYLSWTATGEDGNVGRARNYDLRMATDSSTFAQWDSATAIPMSISPSPSGHHESIKVGRLIYNLNYYFAIKVIDSSNQSSEISNFDSSGAISDFEVPFADAALLDTVRYQLGLPARLPLYSELLTLGVLRASRLNINSLTGLSYMRNLRHVWLQENDITDLSAISDLTYLRSLYIDRNPISDLSPIAANVHLTWLWAFQDSISDISPLASLVMLVNLNLNNNTITNLQPLATMQNLNELRLSGNQIADISPLASITKLTTLNLNYNNITDISTLSVMSNVIVLQLQNNAIEDITPLAGLTKLLFLSLSANNITDLTPLSGLLSLRKVLLGSNQIVSLHGLSTLTVINELILDNNMINDVYPLVLNEGIGAGDIVLLRSNPLSSNSVQIHIPALESRGARVIY